MKPRYRGAHRSGLEDKVAKHLQENNIPYEFEKHKLSYILQCCKNCGEPVSVHTYTPDFVFTQFSPRLVVESKGLFSSKDRSKMIAVKKCNPKEDIRLLFQRDQKIQKNSKTSYSQWAEKNGFPWAVGTQIPVHWLGLFTNNEHKKENK